MLRADSIKQFVLSGRLLDTLYFLRDVLVLHILHVSCHKICVQSDHIDIIRS